VVLVSLGVVKVPDTPLSPLGEEVHAVLLVDDHVISVVELYAIGFAPAVALMVMVGALELPEAEVSLPLLQAARLTTVSNTQKNSLKRKLERTGSLFDILYTRISLKNREAGRKTARYPTHLTKAICQTA
jgi:hypothetical protein